MRDHKRAESMRPGVLLLALYTSVAASDAAAGDLDYPKRPINLIVTGIPGGPPDIVARWVAAKLSPALGQPIVVVNRGGAGGNLAMQAAAASAPDGYTLVVAGQGPFALNPHMYAQPGYDALKDFTPVTQVERGSLILATHPDVPIHSVGELVQLAKAKPGQLSYGSPGIGTPPHMASELFSRMAQIDVLRVPYPGPPPAMIDLMAGRLTYTFGDIRFQLPQVRAGKIRALAVTSAKRSAVVADLPTIAESGFPGFDYAGWLGIAAPAGTPAAIVSKLQSELAKLLHAHEAKAYFGEQGRETVGSSPEEFSAYIRAEYAKWGPIIRAAGIRTE
jgi:tripartite-type tricarboxylate transporter receptor subunit TctC